MADLPELDALSPNLGDDSSDTRAVDAPEVSLAAAQSHEYSWRKALALCAEVDRFIGEGAAKDGPKSDFAAQLEKQTSFGVKQGLTQMVAHSKWEAAPKWSMRPKIPVDLRATSAPPGPGTYDQKSTVGKAPCYGFGIGNRFRVPEISQRREKVGPGAYNPRNPLHNVGAKVGFGTSVRVPMGASVISAPGPGAYEFKTSMGGGVMYTAQGKTASSYMKKDQTVPGPGAYTPGWRWNSAIKEPAAPGFGTSSRNAEFDRAVKNPSAPGPGTYEMQNFKGMGREGIKYSAQARRQGAMEIVQNPGPGAYNSHVTSFGY